MGKWRDKIVDRTPIEKAIHFCELLKQPDGLNSGSNIVLAKFQKDIIQIFGRDKNGNRVVDRVLITFPRKNGKSALTALFILYLLVMESIRNAQHYSIAADRDQAGILFNLARNMVLMSPELSEIISITESRKLLTNVNTGATFQALSSEGKTKHGRSSRLVCVDELHAIPPSSELVSVMETSMGAYGKEGLFIIIGTQSPDDNNPMSQWVDYANNVNDGTITDDSFAGFVWSAPDDIDIWDQDEWYKCNPAMAADFRSYDEMKKTAKRAKEIGGVKVAEFQNLYLNQRIDTSNPFISKEAWVSNDHLSDDDAFQQYPVYGGLDLSKRGDLTSMVLVCEDDQGFIHTKTYAWTPKELLKQHEKTDKAPYRDWVEKGFIEAAPGNSIGYDWLATRIMEINANFPMLVNIAYDRWKIDELSREIEKIGGYIELAEHGQGYKDMSPAIDDLTHAIAERLLCHNGNPLLTWCISNAVSTSDPAGNLKLDKEKSFNRIDPVIALVMAVHQLKVAQESSGISGGEGGILFV